MHTILIEHCIRPEVWAESFADGDRVAFTLTDWDGGEVTIEGIITARFVDGAYRVRTGDKAVYKVPAEVLQRVSEGGAP
jgi:hypothetical protein